MNIQTLSYFADLAKKKLQIPHVAEEAVNLINVDYQPLPHVLWVLDAMQPDAPLLREDLRTDEMGQKAERPSNVERHLHFEKGNVEQGFAEAEVVIVTGGTRGIGLGIVRVLARSGARLVVTGRKPERLERVASSGA